MNGYEFVRGLHEDYGLLEAYRIGTEYLEFQKDTTNEEEIRFCEEVRSALEELDKI